MPLGIEVGKVFSIRFNAHDIEVLDRIAKAHPHLPDPVDLVRQALREYDLCREKGSKQDMIAEILYGVRLLLAANHVVLHNGIDALPSSRGEYERPVGVVGGDVGDSAK